MSGEGDKSDQLDILPEAVRKAFDFRVGKNLPEFDTIWSAAEIRVQSRKQRYRIISAAASIAVLAIILGILLPRQSRDLADSELTEAMMVSVQWVAPSDVLLPDYAFDIYQDVPELIHTTDLTKGLLL